MAREFIPLPVVPLSADTSPAPSAFSLLSIIGAAAATYHGYKRNKSISWALVWGTAGSFAPVITNVIALAQGYGKPASGGQ